MGTPLVICVLCCMPMIFFLLKKKKRIKRLLRRTEKPAETKPNARDETSWSCRRHSGSQSAPLPDGSVDNGAEFLRAQTEVLFLPTPTQLSDECVTCRPVGPIWAIAALSRRAAVWQHLFNGCKLPPPTPSRVSSGAHLIASRRPWTGPSNLGSLIDQPSKCLHQGFYFISQLKCFPNTLNLSHVSGEEEFKESLWGKVRR